MSVRGQSPEVPVYQFLELRLVVDVGTAKVVRWLSRVTRNVSHRVPRSVADSALVPRQTVRSDAESGQTQSERDVQA